jgi:hypothetical protein
MPINSDEGIALRQLKKPKKKVHPLSDRRPLPLQRIEVLRTMPTTASACVGLIDRVSVGRRDA